MAEQSFIYVTYIRTTPECVWEAFTGAGPRDFWLGMTQESGWKPGDSWRLLFEDGRVADTGEILEAAPPRRLVLKWRNEFKPEIRAEGYSRCALDIEPAGDGVVKLIIVHSIEPETGENPSRFVTAVSGGWPLIIANLKSRLETGAVILTER